MSVVPGPGGKPPAGSVKGASCTTSCLIYHSGPVQLAPVEHFIYWEPPGYSHPLPSAYTSGLTTWLNAVAAEDGTSTDVFGVANQYYDVTGGSNNYIPYAITAAAPKVDGDALPASNGCAVPTGFSACLTEAQIQTEIQTFITANGLPQGIDNEYVLFTPQGVDSCFSGQTGSPCAYAGTSFYCGYHQEFGNASNPIVYANLPWLYQTSCDGLQFYSTGYPNQSTAPSIDPEVGIVSHEMMESITDPTPGTGWVDSSGNEIGDKCAYNYSGLGQGSNSGLSNNGQGDYNQTINGHQYLMQTEFSNASSSCIGSTPPVATITPPGTLQANVPVTFNGSSSTDGSSPTALTYAWNFGDHTTGTGATAAHTYAAPGTYNVTLTVTDANHFIDTQTIPVTVSPAQAPPTAAFTLPSGALVGQAVTFDGSGSSTPGGGTVTYAWNFGDGSIGTGATTAHTYTAAGTYSVSLTVTDSGGSNTLTQPITISAPQPAVVISPTASFSVATAHPVRSKPVAFAATASDPNPGGSITGYSWTFGDGSTGTGATPAHTYAKAGTYTVTLTVTDREGGTTTASKSVTVLTPSTITRIASRNHGRVVMVSVDGPGTISIGRSRVTVHGAGTAKLTITLSKHQRALVATGHRITVRVAIEFVPLAGSPVTRRKTVTITK